MPLDFFFFEKIKRKIVEKIGKITKITLALLIMKSRKSNAEAKTEIILGLLFPLSFQVLKTSFKTGLNYFLQKTSPTPGLGYTTN